MHFVGKSQTFNYFEERMTKPNTIMGRVHLCETKQCTLILPYPRQHLFCPVAGNCKVRILISCLPGIACETYESSLVALDRNMYQLNRQPVGNRSLTVTLRWRLSMFFLKRVIICFRVTLRLGILTHLVARDEMSIIFWKDGWSRVCIGWICELDHLRCRAEGMEITWSVSMSHSVAASHQSESE